MPSAPIKRILRKASRQAVKTAVLNLKKYTTVRQWVGANNAYKKIYINNPSGDLLTRRSLKQKQIRDYVAASIFTHCSDGWSLLGRALECHSKGDHNTTVHLAYYSELRAAMTGTPNSRHLV